MKCKLTFDRHCFWVGVHVWNPVYGTSDGKVYRRNEITLGLLGVLLRIYWFKYEAPPSDS